ncbi:MAG TPA: glycosyltransferase family 2 protein [Chloroflexia bacterium]|nr:glycosyltransferase family 2 protein [Chloroflexia bacterium]
MDVKPPKTETAQPAAPSNGADGPPVRPVGVAAHERRLPHHAALELERQLPDAPPDLYHYSLSVVIPAYNEGDSVHRVVEKIRDLRPHAEIIVVDDASKDNTAEVARDAGARVIRHPYNKGNGAAVKTGIRAARGDVVLLLDADGQHPPEDINHVLAGIGEYDLVVGARTRQSETSWVRDLGNGIFNGLASYLAGRRIPDLTSGFRAMKRDMILEFIHLLPNLYSYPTTSTLAFMKAGYNVGFVDITARKGTGRSNTKILRDGVRAVMIILRIITLFAPLKIFLPLSILLFLTGILYGVWNIWVMNIPRIPNGSVMLILSSLFIFLFGLISEQIAALRFEHSQRPRLYEWGADDGYAGVGPGAREAGAVAADGSSGPPGAPST